MKISFLHCGYCFYKILVGNSQFQTQVCKPFTIVSVHCAWKLILIVLRTLYSSSIRMMTCKIKSSHNGMLPAANSAHYLNSCIRFRIFKCFFRMLRMQFFISKNQWNIKMRQQFINIGILLIYENNFTQDYLNQNAEKHSWNKPNDDCQHSFVSTIVFVTTANFGHTQNVIFRITHLSFWLKPQKIRKHFDYHN